ncbi:MAG: oligoribonuclease, partial [Variovorax sp.]|nr:oligoribonuclease [Variovorax sp.]
MPQAIDPTSAAPSAPAAPTLKKSDQNLVWLDCEMTGLDPEK